MNGIEGMNDCYVGGCSPARGYNLNPIHEPCSNIFQFRPSFICHYFADSYLQSFKNTQKKPPFLTSLLPVFMFLAAQNLPQIRWLDWNVSFKTGVCVLHVHMLGHITMNIYSAFQIFQDKIFWNIILLYNQIYWAQNDPFWVSYHIYIKNIPTWAYWLSTSPYTVFRTGC